MTTGISILVDSIPTCLQVPLEAIQVDSVSFVYKKTKTGYVRQEVVTGPSNDISICIAAGLQKGDQLSLNAPELRLRIFLLSTSMQLKRQLRKQNGVLNWQSV